MRPLRATGLGNRDRHAMPPSPNQNESREQATVRWLTSLLAALVQQSAGGSLTISPQALAEDHSGVDLLEERDSAGNIVLRFAATRHLAVYKLEHGAVEWQSPTAASPASSQQASPASSVGSTSPKSAEEIARREETMRKQQLANQILAGQLNRERQKVQSLESLLEQQQVLNPK